MYEGDSFFTLGTAAQMGLGAISAILGLSVLWLGYRMMRRRRRFRTRMIIALGLLWAFIWQSPQVYYLYYIAIFDGLPWQIVVRDPPGPITIYRYLSFTGPQNLSAHSQGLLGWALIATGIFRLK